MSGWYGFKLFFNFIDFDLETKDRQLNIANAQIQKIEAEKVRLEKTNYILGERIKLLEGNRTARLEEGCEQINRRLECSEEAPNDNYNNCRSTPATSRCFSSCSRPRLACACACENKHLHSVDQKLTEVEHILCKIADAITKLVDKLIPV